MTALPEPQRRALKSRLRAIGALPPKAATSKAALLALAEQHGIDIASLPTTPLPAGATAPADKTQPAALPSMAEMLDKMANGPWSGPDSFRATLERLHAVASSKTININIQIKA